MFSFISWNANAANNIPLIFFFFPYCVLEIRFRGWVAPILDWYKSSNMTDTEYFVQQHFNQCISIQSKNISDMCSNTRTRQKGVERHSRDTFLFAHFKLIWKCSRPLCWCERSFCRFQGETIIWWHSLIWAFRVGCEILNLCVIDLRRVTTIISFTNHNLSRCSRVSLILVE